MTQEPEEACPQFYMLIVFIKHILHLKRHHLNPIFTINNYYRKHFKREKNKYFHCECLAWGNTRVRLERIVAKIPLSSHMNGHKAFSFSHIHRVAQQVAVGGKWDVAADAAV